MLTTGNKLDDIKKIFNCITSGLGDNDYVNARDWGGCSFLKIWHSCHYVIQLVTQVIKLTPARLRRRIRSPLSP